jgi:hypothetical protein
VIIRARFAALSVLSLVFELMNQLRNSAGVSAAALRARARL